jgi:hypothetical protein
LEGVLVADLVRVAAPDGAVAAVRGMSGREYRAEGGGMFSMTAADAAAMRAEGGFAPSLGTPAAGGFECLCGFRPVVRRCSRCGSYCER